MPTVTPVLVPELRYHRVTQRDEGASDTETDTSFALSGGANIGFGSFFVGCGLRKVLQEGSSTELRLQFGVAF